jgi:hypothetical protein
MYITTPVPVFDTYALYITAYFDWTKDGKFVHTPEHRSAIIGSIYKYT